jgi:catechol 2,3-dioxygenase-like lactoylglutathione lyase family enzyme
MTVAVPTTLITERGQMQIEGIHHLKFAVADLERSEAFYSAAFGAKRLSQMDHHMPDGTLFAVILDMPGLGTLLELRLDAASARAQANFDPVTLNVADVAALNSWIAHFDRCGLPHSPVLTGLVSWIVVVADPDQRRLRLYSRETHGPELAAMFDDPWLFPAPLGKSA